MRDKQEILNDAQKDILNKKYKQDAPFWLTYRLIEVLIDTRDELHELNQSIGSNFFDHARES